MSVKYRDIAAVLADEIRAGKVLIGDRLPAEADLARRFSASRGTIRRALASLQTNGMIETWAGAGSFVTYDGVALDERVGWATALAQHGLRSSTRTITLDKVTDPALAAALGLDQPEFLNVDRIRHISGADTDDEQAISLERSRVPWRSELADVPGVGLTGGSLSRTLAERGIRAVGGREVVAVVKLDNYEASLLGQDAGTAFMRTTRTVYDRDGVVVEYVTSLLDPVHFQLDLSFGERTWQ